jgi:hypothetical protein
MLSPRLTNCVDCTTVSALLADIDCKLTTLANNQYNNVVFILNKPFPDTVLGDLLNYKRILTNRLCNPNYACTYSTEQIASRVKLLIHK